MSLYESRLGVGGAASPPRARYAQSLGCWRRSRSWPHGLAYHQRDNVLDPPSLSKRRALPIRRVPSVERCLDQISDLLVVPELLQVSTQPSQGAADDNFGFYRLGARQIVEQ